MTPTRLPWLEPTPIGPCVFCEIVAGRKTAATPFSAVHSLAIVPKNPVTSGHLLVLPRVHVKDAYEDTKVTAQTMLDAARWAAALSFWNSRYRSVNFITSVGRAATTQTVLHLHLHLVPRARDDGLALPWTGQQV